MRIGRLHIYAAMQSRGANGDNPAWLGFSYGSWLPRFKLRGNHWYKELFVYWLCFHVSFNWHREGY